MHTSSTLRTTILFAISMIGRSARRAALSLSLGLSLLACGHHASASTTINENFNPSVINQGDSSLYTISISNDSTTPLENAEVTVFLDNTVGSPNVSSGHITVATGTVLSNSCSFGSVTAAAGSNTIVLSGGTIPAGSVSVPSICTFSLNVTSIAVGTFNAVIPANTTPDPTHSGYQATENLVPVNNATSADITLQVNALSAATGSKTFSPSPAIAGDPSILTITLSNPNGSATMPLTSFTDPLPAGMVVANPPNASTSCNGAGSANGVLTPTPNPGDSSITLTGGTIGQGGTCTISVNVVVSSINSTSQAFNNSLGAGAIGNTRGLTSPAFSKSLTVNTPIGVNKSFNPTLIPATQPSLLTITLSNNSTSSTLPITSFSDDMTAISITLLDHNTPGAADPSVSCTGSGATDGTLTATAGTSLITLAGAAAGPGGHCTISVYVTSTVDGQHFNTILANAVQNPNNYPSPLHNTASLTDNAQLTVSKAATVSNVAPGQWTQFTVTIDNWSGGSVSGVNFKDLLPAPVVSLTTYQMVLQGSGNPISSVGCSGGTWYGTDATGTSTGLPPADGDAGIMWSGGTVAAGSGSTPGTCTIVFEARLPASTPTSTSFSNQIPINGANGTCNGASCTVGNGNPVNNPAASNAVNVLTVDSGAVTKSFSPTTIAQGGLSTLTIAIYNRTVNPLTGVSLTDNLPVGLTLAANPAATLTCSDGSSVGTLHAFPGSEQVALTGATVPARPAASEQASCTITVKVTGTVVGPYTNTIHIADFSNNQGVTIPADVSAGLTINTGLGATKSFSPTSVTSGGTARVTLTINNTSNGQLTNVSVNDSTFSAGLNVANPANAATSCAGSPTIVANPGASSAQLFGATISAGGSCQMSFDVVTSGAGGWSNTVPTGNITSAEGLSSTADVTASLSAVPAQININKSFNPVIVTGGVPSTLTLTLTNPSSAPLHGIGFTDVFPTGIQVYSVPAVSSNCAGGTVTAIPGDGKVSLAGATMPANSTCTITLQTTSIKFLNLTNDIPAGSIISEEGYTNPSLVSATLSTLQGLGVMKAFSPSYVTANAVTTLKMWLVSTFDPHAPTPMVLTGVSYTDTLPAGLVVANPASASTTCPGPGGAGFATITANPGSSLVTVSAAQISPGTNCEIDVNVLAPGSLGTYTNTIAANSLTTDQGPTNNNPASAPLTVVSQPTIGKTFSQHTVNVGTASTLTVTISNGSAINLTGVALSDTLPSGLEINSTASASTTCANGTVTAIPGTNVLSLSGATVPNGASCTFQAAVVANATGTYFNAIGAGQIVSNEGLSNPGPASDTLTVRNAPTVSKAFSPATIDGSGVGIGTGISTLTISLGNSNASSITLTSALVDALPANLSVANPPSVVKESLQKYTIS